jgi:threonylcarbamoyladenosine tRNA methylthiotransferase MtaB
MAANSLSLIEDCDIVMGHIFPYSAKAGTPAARMPQLAPPVIKERAARLRAAAAARKAKWLQGLVGRRGNVLVERSGRHGHGEDFAPVRLLEAEAPGTIVTVRLDAVVDGKLTGARM